ncbi:mechanosensitive ion channel family protein [Candidatus Woesebacteria bacterium]|nr:mechanosensitive ion channel family protein [Candidatus Woesebacteria bacterium]
MLIADKLSQPQYFFPLLFVWIIILIGIISAVFGALLKHVFSKTKTEADDHAISRIKNACILLVLTGGSYLFLLYRNVEQRVELQIEKVLLSLGIFLISVVFFEIIALIIVKLQIGAEQKRNNHLLSAFPFFKNIMRVVVGGICLLWILEIYQVSITPFLASAGVLGVAIAFASKDFVANLFGGISVFFDNPYSLGDYVIIQEKYRGEVMEIGMRSTKIRTRDNVLLTVPNSVMVTNAVINETGYNPELRVRIPILVTYDSDIEKVEHVLLEVASTHNEVLQMPVPLVRYRALADSGMSLELMFVISDPANKGRIIHEVIKKIHGRFKKEHINLAFPTQEIYNHTVR